MSKKLLNQLVAAVIGTVVAMSALGLSDEKRAEIAERLTPAGEVCVAGDPCAANAAASAGGAAKSGEEVYNTSCMACHSTGAAGAPKLGDAAAWNDRMGKGLETVYSNAINGINGMPPKGTCMSCSDDEIKAAVDHILENSK